MGQEKQVIGMGQTTTGFGLDGGTLTITVAGLEQLHSDNDKVFLGLGSALEGICEYFKKEAEKNDKAFSHDIYTMPIGSMIEILKAAVLEEKKEAKH